MEVKNLEIENTNSPMCKDENVNYYVHQKLINYDYADLKCFNDTYDPATETDKKLVKNLSEEHKIEYEDTCKIITIFEKLVGFQSPCISYKDLMQKLSISIQSDILDKFEPSITEAIYVFWRRKRGQ